MPRWKRCHTRRANLDVPGSSGDASHQGDRLHPGLRHNLVAHPNVLEYTRGVGSLGHVQDLVRCREAEVYTSVG